MVTHLRNFLEEHGLCDCGKVFVYYILVSNEL